MNEDIFKDLEKIEKIKDIDELLKLYSFNDLKLLYKKTQEIDQSTDELFLIELSTSFSKEKIEILWSNKKTISKYNLLLLKALIAVERNNILSEAENIANKLSAVLGKI